MQLLVLFFVLYVAGMAFSSFPGDEDFTVAADEFPAPIGGMATIVL
jgi:hypothetical protein